MRATEYFPLDNPFTLKLYFTSIASAKKCNKMHLLIHFPGNRVSSNIIAATTITSSNTWEIKLSQHPKSERIKNEKKVLMNYRSIFCFRFRFRAAIMSSFPTAVYIELRSQAHQSRSAFFLIKHYKIMFFPLLLLWKRENIILMRFYAGYKEEEGGWGREGRWRKNGIQLSTFFMVSFLIFTFSSHP